MSKNENASRRWSRPAKRRTETIAAQQLVPRLYCITRAGGVQAILRQPIIDRRHIVGEAKREFELMQSRQEEPCSYDVFVDTVMGVLGL